MLLKNVMWNISLEHFSLEVNKTKKDTHSMSGYQETRKHKLSHVGKDTDLQLTV